MTRLYIVMLRMLRQRTYLLERSDHHKEEFRTRRVGVKKAATGTLIMFVAPFLQSCDGHAVPAGQTAHEFLVIQ